MTDTQEQNLIRRLNDLAATVVRYGNKIAELEERIGSIGTKHREEFLSKSDVARLKGKDPSTVYYHIQMGHIGLELHNGRQMIRRGVADNFFGPDVNQQSITQ